MNVAAIVDPEREPLWAKQREQGTAISVKIADGRT